MDQDTRKRGPNWSFQVKDLILEGIAGAPYTRRRPLFTVNEVSQLPSAPSRSTIFAWQHDSRYHDTPYGPQKKRGRPSLLSDAEKLVLGGFVHQCNRDHRAVSLERVRSFIWEAFGENASDSIISRDLKSLGFRSHQTGTYHAFVSQAKKEEAKELLTAVREWVITNLDGTSRCVFEDEMTQWDSVFALRSYSPVGRFVFVFRPSKRQQFLTNFGCIAAGTPKSDLHPEQKRLSFIQHYHLMER